MQQPVQITLSSPVATKPSFDTGIKSEATFGAANDDQASQAASGSKLKPTCDATELAEMMDGASDGEIMDGEENADTIKMNKIQQVAETTLKNQNKSKSKSKKASGRCT